MPTLELKNVCKGYGSGPARTLVLKDVNLQVNEGEFIAIVGFSGAGKTTLVSLLAGLLKADAGSVEMRGEPITGPGPDRGVVFQNYSLLPWMTVQANVELAVRKVYPNLSRADRRAWVQKYVAMVNLTPALHKKPRELSGGMRQRVSVARALAMNPQVLLMDEPLGALDALTRATLQDEIARIWQRDRKTVVLVTNDVEEAALLADRIIPLTPGPGATLGPSFAVDLPRPRVRADLAHNPRFKQVRAAVTRYLLEVSGVHNRKLAPRVTCPPLVPARIVA